MLAVQKIMEAGCRMMYSRHLGSCKGLNTGFWYHVLGNEDNEVEDQDGEDYEDAEEEEEEDEDEDEDGGEDSDDDDSDANAEIVDRKGKGIMTDDKGKGKLVEVSQDSSDSGSESDADSDLSDDPLAEIDLDNILPSRTRRRVVQPGVHISKDQGAKEDEDDSD
nr:nucleolin-like [Coffea arabica]